jgi:alkylation response protein AidB-like acyl-CoA dehydrogenase
MQHGLTEEQQDFRDSVRRWVEREWPKDKAREIEAQESFPHELWDSMKLLELHGIAVGEEYGGQAAGVVTQTIVARELGRSLAYMTWVWATTSFCGKTLEASGQEELKRDLLPKVVSGDARFAIAVTEPDGGTDLLGAMQTKAAKVDGGWRLNGAKVWSTQAHISDYLMVIARTDDEVAKRSEGLTLFFVPREAPGITIQMLPKLGMRSIGSCQVFFDDVEVADRFVIGEPGKGWRALLSGLNNERILQAAVCTGIIDGILEDALAYAQERQAFGRPIGQFQAIQHFIADIAMAQAQSELMVQNAAAIQEAGTADRIEAGRAATMAKVVVSELATKAADTGIQILGGAGYSMETDMQRYWRDVRLARIGPITNEMARNTIAEGLGLPRSF